jgi:hypothetical protein
MLRSVLLSGHREPQPRMGFLRMAVEKLAVRTEEMAQAQEPARTPE